MKKLEDFYFENGKEQFPIANNIFANKTTITECLHDKCACCGGSGINRETGRECIHAISCPCSRCK